MPKSIMQMGQAADARSRRTMVTGAKSEGQPRGSISPGRMIWLRPRRMPSTSQACGSRGRTAVTQKPSRMESHGMKISVIRAKLSHVE